MSIGSRLKFARKQRGLKQAELAQLTGYRQSRISEFEHDKAVPDVPTLTNIAKHLHVRLSFLAEGHGAESEAVKSQGPPMIEHVILDGSAEKQIEDNSRVSVEEMSQIVKTALTEQRQQFEHIIELQLNRLLIPLKEAVAKLDGNKPSGGGGGGGVRTTFVPSSKLPRITTAEFMAALRTQRQSMNLQPKEVSEKAELPKATVANWERGRSLRLSFEDVAKVERALKLHGGELWEKLRELGPEASATVDAFDEHTKVMQHELRRMSRELAEIKRGQFKILDGGHSQAS